MTRDTIEQILNTSTIEAIRAATTGTCQLLDPESVRAVALTDTRQLTQARCMMLKDLLLDPRSWHFCRKRCLPRKTALFRLEGPAAVVTVEVDFGCIGWIVMGPRERRGGFFDPVKHELRDLLKSTFVEFASSDRRSLWKQGVIAGLRSQGKEKPESRANGGVKVGDSVAADQHR